MTEYGLKILNTDGEIQIDGSFVNYSLRDGDNSKSIGSSIGTVAHSFSPSTPYPPVVLIKPLQDIPLCLIELTYSSPNYTGFRVGGAANATYSYRVFYPAGNKSSEDYGLRVYNADEKLVFDSGYAPFRIINVISATIGSTYSHGATDSKVWYIITPLQYGFNCTWPGPPAPLLPVLGRVSGIQRVNSSQVKVAWCPIGQVWQNTQCMDYGETGSSVKLIVCECDE
jgi:hypothetical protein